jgi:hypothetical protein
MSPRSFLLEIAPARFQALEADTPARWGKMSAQHMVKHLFNVFTVSRKDVGLPCVTPEEKWPKIQTWLWNEEPFVPEFKAVGVPAEPPAYRFEDLAAAKAALLSNLTKFYAFYESHLGRRMMHPLFGLLDLAE